MPSDTKQAIAAAFAQLSQKKPVDKITVKDLVEHCGISRQTFYYHFQDILDVMEWSIRQLPQKATDNSLHLPSEAEAIEEFIVVARCRAPIPPALPGGAWKGSEVSGGICG